MNPWADMVRFGTGGEANAISIRIARAAGKDDVMVGMIGIYQLIIIKEKTTCLAIYYLD